MLRTPLIALALALLALACDGTAEPPATPTASPAAASPTPTPTITPSATLTPTVSPSPTVPAGSPFSFEDIRAAFRAGGMELTLEGPSAGFSSFGTPAFDTRVARGDDSIELSLLIYEGREAINEDWRLTIGQSPLPREGRTVPDHVSTWWNENIVAVVRSRLGDLRTDALAVFLALGRAEHPPVRVFFKRHGNELWSVNPDGSDPLRLTSKPATDYLGSNVGSGVRFWHSRHGDRVAFVGTDGDLWVIDSTGKNLRRYSEEATAADETYYGTSVRVSGWSPDGSKIVYAVESQFGMDEGKRERPETGFYSVDLKTGKRTRLPGLPNFVGWTDDPNKVIFERRSGDDSADWYTLDLSTGATAKFTVLPFQCFSLHASLLFDANRLLYSCGNLRDGSNIVIANIDNTDQQVLFEGLWAELQFPLLSPSGDYFTYQHQSGVQAGGTVTIDLQRFNLHTGDQKTLATGCSRAKGWFDNQSVLVVEIESDACRLGDASLYLIDAASGARTALASDVDFE